MRGASWGRHLGSIAVLLFALATASTAWASGPAPAASARAHTAAPAAAHVRHGHARRPIFLGLLAAAFLLIGALAGANDRPDGDPPRQ